MARYAQAVAQVDAVHAVTPAERAALARVPAQRGERRGPRASAAATRRSPRSPARKAVNMLYEECGGSGLFESSDFQRLWRDTNAASAAPRPDLGLARRGLDQDACSACRPSAGAYLYPRLNPVGSAYKRPKVIYDVRHLWR